MEEHTCHSPVTNCKTWKPRRIYVTASLSVSFQQSVLPKLAMHSEGELWALAGMFTGRHMPETARFIADYTRAVGQAEGEERPPPDPARFLAEWEAEQQAIAAIKLPFTRGTASIECELDEPGGAMSLDIEGDDSFLALLRGADGDRLRGNLSEQLRMMACD
jgi:hypothetical protein